MRTAPIHILIGAVLRKASVLGEHRDQLVANLLRDTSKEVGGRAEDNAEVRQFASLLLKGGLLVSSEEDTEGEDQSRLDCLVIVRGDDAGEKVSGEGDFVLHGVAP
jgi:hypothetical protein